MRFPPHFLDDIRSRISVSQIVGKTVNLKRKGREHLGLCPFHNEKTPSFTVNDDKGFYHCFGCGAHGNAIDFLIEAENYQYKEAVEKLAQEAGVAMPVIDLSPEQQQKIQAEKSKREKLLEIQKLACAWFQKQFYANGTEGHNALTYLQDRKLSDEAIALFMLGYAPAKRYGLKEYLLSKHVSVELLMETGLLIKNDKGDIYDRFRGRIIFPICDKDGNVIAFGGRALGDGTPKYLNSAETPLFHKGKVLYNEHLARKPAYDNQRVIIAEGYMDVISLYSAGFHYAVAPLGTAVTEDHLHKLWRYTKQPLMCLDGDQAGKRAMYRVAELCLPLLKPGNSLGFIELPKGMDPDDFLQARGKEAFSKLMDKPKSLSQSIIEKECPTTAFKTPEQQAEVKHRLALLANRITDTVVKEQYKQFFNNYIWKLSAELKKNYRNESLHPYHKITLDHIEDKTGIQRCEEAMVMLVSYFPDLLQDEEVEEFFIDVQLCIESLEQVRDILLEIKQQNPDCNSEAIKVALGNKGYGALIKNMQHVTSSFAHLTDIIAIKHMWRQYRVLHEKLIVESQLVHAIKLLSEDFSEEALTRVAELRKQIERLEHQLREEA